MFKKDPYSLSKKNRGYITTHITLKDKINELTRPNGYDLDNMIDAMKELNKTHSTHLSDKEIKVLANRVIKKYSNYLNLKNCLNANANTSIQNLFNELCSPCQNSMRKNISFASKFIVVFSKYFGCSAIANFSIYDGRVSSVLYDYLDHYGLSIKYSRNDFKKSANNHNNNVNTLWNFYKNYCSAIGDLIKVASKIEGYPITREEADLIMWF